MGIETERVGIRFIVDIIILAIKTGRFNLLVDILVAVIRAKLSWDVAIGRLNETFYQKQIDQAVDKYKSEHPKDFETDVSGIPGMEKWLKEQGK